MPGENLAGRYQAQEALLVGLRDLVRQQHTSVVARVILHPKVDLIQRGNARETLAANRHLQVSGSVAVEYGAGFLHARSRRVVLEAGPAASPDAIYIPTCRLTTHRLIVARTVGKKSGARWQHSQPSARAEQKLI